MMKPNAKLIASRSASVTAGTAFPARVSVATTDPGPTRTNAAVPNNSANARCGIECIFLRPLYLTSVRQCRTDFTNRSLVRTVCQQAIWALRPKPSSTVSLARGPCPGFGGGNHDSIASHALRLGFHAQAERDRHAGRAQGAH